MRSVVLLSLMFVTLFVSAATGQNDSRSAPNPALLKAASLQVPKNDGAWSVRVMQAGGLAGQTVDVAVTSTGELTCVPESDARCKVNAQEVVQSIVGLMDPKLLRNSKSSLGESCRDCIVTSITIGRRDEKGKIDTYFAYWDDVTAAKAPFQLVRIATTLLGSLKK